jgi:CRISPR-associated protein Cmr2
VTDSARLYFSIGPVQGFVAQARRTRDLWAGSFLLSYLSNAAMDAVVAHGGRVVLPARGPVQPFGTVPNRFLAEGVDAEGAREAAASVQRAWARIAEAVWQDVVEHVARLGKDTRPIWTRQVNGFWEITWAIGAPGCLDARKHWRTPPLRVEGGDHCALMSDLQEISGYVRAREQQQQDDFWAALRARCGVLDLAKDERLCAVALIKRLFPRVVESTTGLTFRAQSWPSTSYLAAVPWLAHVARHHRDTMRDYASRAQSLAGKAFGERHTHIACLRDVDTGGSRFLHMDGNFFFVQQLENANRTPFDEPAGDDDPKRRALVRALEEIHRQVGRKPAPYYALLSMDGDSMGKLLSQARELHTGTGAAEEIVTRSLKAFADQVPDLVRAHNGVPVYAGGDDVLALLPAPDACACAAALAERYRRSFAQHCPPALAGDATLSGAIVYAHYATALRQVLVTAHRLLDDVAKDATGRDSLAIGILKGSALVCEWSAPWRHLQDGQAPIGAHLLDELVQAFAATGTRARELSSGFLFGVRRWLATLTDDALELPGRLGRLPAEVDVQALLVAEYLRARAAEEDAGDASDAEFEAQRDRQREQAEALVGKLLRVCRRTWREPPAAPGTEAAIVTDEHSFGFDGLYLIRFLALELEGEAA